jgi:DNA-binding response OmpR family regulator
MTKKILIVEDEEHIIELLRAIFEGFVNYQVTYTRDGQEAIKVAQVNVPDIILLDIHIPELDGYEVCKLVKSNPTTSRTKVLMISGIPQNHDMLKSQEVGADDYILKPFTSATLINKIAALLKSN